jgi:hypothetical protein
VRRNVVIRSCQVCLDLGAQRGNAPSFERERFANVSRREIRMTLENLRHRHSVASLGKQSAVRRPRLVATSSATRSYRSEPGSRTRSGELDDRLDPRESPLVIAQLFGRSIDFGIQALQPTLHADRSGGGHHEARTRTSSNARNELEWPLLARSQHCVAGFGTIARERFAEARQPVDRYIEGMVDALGTLDELGNEQSQVCRGHARPENFCEPQALICGERQ